MQDAMIVKDPNNLMEKKKIDLLFCQVNKHKPNMQFDNFLQVLTLIGEYKYPMGNQSLSLKRLLDNHLMPLYDQVH